MERKVVCGYNGCFRPIPHNRTKYCSSAHSRLAKRERWRRGLAQAQRGVCYLCFLPLDCHDWSVDHIIPKSAGGSGRADNLAAAHKLCNQLKGNKRLADLGGPAWFREQTEWSLRRRLAKHIRRRILWETRVALRARHPKERRSYINNLARVEGGPNSASITPEI